MHVEITFGIVRTGDIGEWQFVNDANSWITFENRLNIENFHRAVAVRNFFARNDFQTFEQRLGFLATVGFDPANDDIHARLFEAMRLFEHREGFADTRGVAEINL